MPELQDSLIGRRFGNYEIESVIGTGGMGAVYAAVHPTLGKRVAIKVLRGELASDTAAVGRLIDEARASTAIGSDHIVEIFDCGRSADGLAYLVMELLVGETLQQLIEREHRLSCRRAIAVARQVAAALIPAHRAGIIHRDLKPQNIFLVQPAGGRERVKVLDFGVAKLLDRALRAGPSTATGTVVGTPHYMAPEQARGEPVDDRTDVYALGVVLYRAISGHLPVAGESLTEVLTNLLTSSPPSMREREPSLVLAPGIDAVVMKALQHEPAERYPEMESFERALAECADAAVAREREAGTVASPSAEVQEPAQPERGAALPEGERNGVPGRSRRRATGEGGSVETAVSTVERSVSRRMLWLRLPLYPLLVGIFLFGYNVLRRRGLAEAGIATELTLFGLGAMVLAYALELGYYLSRKHRWNPRVLHLTLIAAFIVVGAYALQLNGTLTNYMVMFYAMVITFARVRLDGRAATFATALSVSCLLGVGLLEHLGVIRYARMLAPPSLPPLVQDSTYAAVIMAGATSFLILAQLAAHVLVRGLESREEALAEVSRGLEGQVAEKVAVLRRRERLRRFLPVPVVDAVVQGENDVRVGYARQKLSMVFCTLDEFFARTAHLEPEDQAAVLNELFGAATSVAERFGAVEGGFCGPSLTLILGAPRQTPETEHAASAVRAALALQRLVGERAQGWRALGAEELPLRVAVHTGYAAVGNFGSETRMHYAAVGPSIELARAAASAGPVDRVILTQAAQALCQGQYTVERCGEVPLPGGSERVALYAIKT